MAYDRGWIHDDTACLELIARNPLALLLVGLLVAPACTASETESTTSVTDEIPTPTITTRATTTLPPTTTAAPTTTTEAPPPYPSYVVFMPRGLSDGFETSVRSISGIIALGLVHTETLHIVETSTADGTVVDQPAGGFVIPVQGAAVDPARHALLLTPDVAETVAELDTDEVVLSRSSAGLRRLDVGSQIRFDTGRAVTVAAIVSDTAFGSEEIITTDPELVGGSSSELRFAVVIYDGTEDALRMALAETLPVDAGFGVHPRGLPSDQTTAVRSQVWIKEIFGEFSYKPTGGGRFTIDPQWVEANIVTADIPLLRSRAMPSRVRRSSRRCDERPGGVRQRRRYRPQCIPGMLERSIRLQLDAPVSSLMGSSVRYQFLQRPRRRARLSSQRGTTPGHGRRRITSGHAWSIPDPGHFEYFGFLENE